MDEFIALLFVVFCSTIGLLILWKLFDITRNSIKKNKNSYNQDQFEKLAKAFIQYRKDNDKRLQNIETILTEEKPRGQLDDRFSSPTIESSNNNGNTKTRTE